jgi:hypothetical protein
VAALTGLNVVLLVVLLASAGVHAVGLASDAIAVIGSPLELDYGEGIVWQQAALIPGPRAYSTDPGLPFIVFHYPPLFHLATRWVAWLAGADMLAAGRTVASLSTFMVVPLLAWLALLATPPSRRWGFLPVVAIVACSLVFLVMAPVRSWGVVMRVDTLGLALGFAGLVAAALAQGRFWGTLAALLLCLGAVFTKQTMMTFGISVALLSIARRPLPAAFAVLLAGGVGVAAVVILQVVTGGGFLANIVVANINRVWLGNLLWVFRHQGATLIFYLVMAAAGLWLVLAVAGIGSGRSWSPWRLADAADWRRTLVLVQLGLSCLVLLTLFKIGSSTNVLLQLCGAGCLTVAVVAAALVGDIPGRLRRAPFLEPRPVTSSLLSIGLLTPMIWAVSLQPVSTWGPVLLPAWVAQDAELVRQIRNARRPVGSENMVLLMQAGAGVMYEPAIVTELAYLGRWNEAPLVAMVRAHGFAFMMTSDGGSTPTDRRTPAVNAAMLEAYPRVREVRPSLWVREGP